MVRPIATAIVASLLWPMAAGASDSASYAPPKSPSRTIDFNPGWRLSKGSFPSGNTDDSSWEEVSTPHTYHEKQAYQGVNSHLKDLGPFTYRKHFTIPAADKGKRLVLEFQGIRQRGTFSLNGHLLGRVSHGVTPFGYDITPYVNFGGENVLHAEIDCGDKEFGTDSPMCWFFPGFNSLYGGIGRNVLLHVMPPLHATLPLYSSLGTEGTYVYATDISTEKRSAEIHAEVEVRNDGAGAAEASCSAVLVDRAGHEVARFTAEPSTIPAGENRIFRMKGKVEGLEFWQPGYPYLYDLRTLVTGPDGVTDVRRISTGFRKGEVRGAAFFLNNRVLMTHGYTPRSQNEWAAVGNAYPDWLHDYSNGMMVAGNTRLVRWEHTMPSPQDIDSCDRVGLPQIVPAADRENDSTGREWEMRKEIMRDTLIYCRNNPSILLWEAANNVLTPAHVEEMIALRNRWDPGWKRPMGGRSEGPEWVSWMYGVRKERYRLSVDTEYLRDESPRRWWDADSAEDAPLRGEWKMTDNAGGWNRNQENICRMMSIVYDQYYKARPGTGPEVCNGGVQIFFADSDSFTRGMDPFRRSGPVDAMRIPKDAYDCNRVMWSDTPELWTEGKPAVFLPGHWNYRPGFVKDLYVFVSPGIARVELRVNGKPVAGGERVNTFQFRFPQVAWEAGTIDAVACDASGKEVARSSHETSGPPAALRLSVIHGPGGLRADGSDLALIQTEVVDAKGRRCPLAGDIVTYGVKGPAVWRGGIYEADPCKYANQTLLPVVCGVHRVIVRSTRTPGIITVSATAPGLSPASVEIPSRKVSVAGGLGGEPVVLQPLLGEAKPVYGPDLPPPPPVPPHAFDQKEAGASASGASILDLRTIFPKGALLTHDARDGKTIYQDRPWVFEGLPSYLAGCDYLKVAQEDVTATAGEGIVFRIGKAGRVYVAYDDANPHFPEVSSPTGFHKTKDTIIINGRPHTIWESGDMNGGELCYLGTSSWTDQPPQGINNYVLFIKSGTGYPYRK